MRPGGGVLAIRSIKALFTLPVVCVFDLSRNGRFRPGPTGDRSRLLGLQGAARPGRAFARIRKTRLRGERGGAVVTVVVESRVIK